MYAVPDLKWSSKVRGNMRGQKMLAIMAEMAPTEERMENRAPAKKYEVQIWQDDEKLGAGISQNLGTREL